MFQMKNQFHFNQSEPTQDRGVQVQGIYLFGPDHMLFESTVVLLVCFIRHSAELL